MTPHPTSLTVAERVILQAASPELTCYEIAEAANVSYQMVYRCVKKFNIQVKKNYNRKSDGKVYVPPKQINRLTEEQKIQLVKEASRQKTIADLCRLIKCNSYDVVWRFCTKHELPYKMKWEAKKERKQAYKSGVFNVDSRGKHYTWLV